MYNSIQYNLPEPGVKCTNYYPLHLDISELETEMNIYTEYGISGKANTKEEKPDYDPENCLVKWNFDAEKLFGIAIQHKCSPFQILLLFLKNSFEGHCYLTFGITPTMLLQEGTRRLDLTHKRTSELSIHFANHYNEYSEGLHEIWNKLTVLLPELKEVCLESLLLFLLSTHLYKLPVSSLNKFDINKFRKLSDKRKRFYRCLFQFSQESHRAIADRFMIDRVDELYKERFQDYLTRLNSLNNLIMQMQTKLLYANDPLIRTMEELEQRFFAFLIESEVVKDSRKVRIGCQSWEDDPDLDEHIGSVSRTIKQLFRTITKNCKEAFTASGNTTPGFDATRFFLDANAVFNEMNTDPVDQVLQYYQLADMFIEIYCTRRIQNLSAVFPEISLLESDRIWGKLGEETVSEFRLAKANKITGLKEHHQTAFQLKHLADNELAQIHEVYLKKQIEYLDQRILEILQEIQEIMKEKTSGVLTQ